MVITLSDAHLTLDEGSALGECLGAVREGALMVNGLPVRWLAVPPMWNVRIVSCVPGSPIDCAAMTPTASPTLTSIPRPRSRP